MNFSNTLTNWYLQNKRDLPWRKTSNPYPIWLSEIILQQTKVAQGLPYYLSFLENFPSVFDLAKANEQEVLKLWQGLGYYSRARNLHNTAKYVVDVLDGVFPKSYTELLTLKGVGQYTAAAIASFAYNEVVPVVDGNVYRVLSRYFNIDTDISTFKAKKEFTNLAQSIIDYKNPALFNQAIMEFGALQCTPKSPNCSICPLQEGCLGLANKKTALLPVKNKKVVVKNRFLNYLLPIDNQNKSIINKRTEKGIWHNLYQLPCIETQRQEPPEKIYKKIEELYPIHDAIIFLDYHTVKHKLTHQHLYICFWKITGTTTHKNGLNYKSLMEYPLPIVLHNFLEQQPY